MWKKQVVFKAAGFQSLAYFPISVKNLKVHRKKFLSLCLQKVYQHARYVCEGRIDKNNLNIKYI